MTATRKKLAKKDIKDISLAPTQRNYFEKIQEDTIVFCWGPAGTSKTFTACYSALQLLARGEVEKIILTKPIKEAGENLGSLPGDVWEKISPHMQSFMNNLEKMIDKEKLGYLISTGAIEFSPLAYMRGSTFDNTIMILDEAQNCDMKQLMLFITRLGNSSKAIIAGDVTQHDIAYEKVALPAFIDMIRGVKKTSEAVFTEDDIVRSEILKEIVKRYEHWKIKNEPRRTRKNNE